MPIAALGLIARKSETRLAGSPILVEMQTRGRRHTTRTSRGYLARHAELFASCGQTKRSHTLSGTVWDDPAFVRPEDVLQRHSGTHADASSR